MGHRTGPQTLELQNLLLDIKKVSLKSNFWKRIAKDLSKPTRQRRVVNLYKINKYAKEGETIIVPGKVLSIGELDKKVNIAAYQFSTQAKIKIENKQGSVITIKELLEKNPQGKKVRILG
tara:strand:+ start:28 stop:387 length:360 start_codon:yes stop_codon:yes gene_type:complete